MNLSTQIAEQVAKLPPELKFVLDASLAAGDKLIHVEIDRSSAGEKVILFLDHALRILPDAAPAGTKYMEIKDCDPMLFGFFTLDEAYAVVKAAFKPMVLQSLGEGPPDPTAAHIAFMEERERQDAAAAAKRAEGMRMAPEADLDPNASDLVRRFISSMKITYDMWHDGTGYDLSALEEMTPSDLKVIEMTLINHSPRDWRDIEALAKIDSDAARKAVEAGLKSSDEQVRREAMNHAAEKSSPKNREALLLTSLQKNDLFGGLSQAIDEAAEFHPPAVVEALLKGALNRDGQIAVHFAALLFYIHGKSSEPFDWNHRPFFLKFNTSDQAERTAAFRELCQSIGVDATKYLNA